jgi:diadenosine tetraphosphate (Ap4A) HIT family hydrolase
MKPGCPFCDVSAERGFRIVKETPDLIAFRDRCGRATERIDRSVTDTRSPQSETHMQIIPRTHVGS